MMFRRALFVAVLLRAATAIKIVEDGDRDGPETHNIGEIGAVMRKIMEANAKATQHQSNAAPVDTPAPAPITQSSAPAPIMEASPSIDTPAPADTPITEDRTMNRPTPAPATPS